MWSYFTNYSLNNVRELNMVCDASTERQLITCAIKDLIHNYLIYTDHI